MYGRQRGGHAAKEQEQDQTKVAAFMTEPVCYTLYPLSHRADPNNLFLKYSLRHHNRIIVDESGISHET